MQVKKKESGLKSKLMAELRKHAMIVALRHEDVRTAGIPDLSTTSGGRTVWWECKHGTPLFGTTGIQELTMLRLAAAGLARYIIWQENADGTERQTLIVRPSNLKSLTAEVSCAGFNMRFLAEYIFKAHRS